MIDPYKLQQRTTGRTIAKSILDLMKSELEYADDDWKAGFLDEMKNNLSMLFGGPIEELKEKVRKCKPMDDKECRILGQQELEIGNLHKGKLICDVPKKYLDYLIQRHPQIVQIERYLLNEKVSRELRQELD